MRPVLQSLLTYFERLERENLPREELDALLDELPDTYAEIHQLAAALDPAAVHRALQDTPQLGEEAPTHGPMAYNQPDTPRHAQPSKKITDPTVAEYEALLIALRNVLS